MSPLNPRRRSLEEIAMEVSTEQDPQRFQKLNEELRNAPRADEPGRQVLLAPNNSQPSDVNESVAYEEVVDHAVALMRSDYASLQMLFPERGTGGELRLLAFRGFNPDAARFWEWVSTRLEEYMRNRVAHHPACGCARHLFLPFHGRFRRSGSIYSDRNPCLPNHAPDWPRRKCRGHDLHALAEGPSILRRRFSPVRRSGKAGS
jgi:hypothetical protein